MTSPISSSTISSYLASLQRPGRSNFAESPESTRIEVDPTRPRGRDGRPLEDAEVAEVESLKQADRQTREHEQAHQRVGRELIMGPASYTYRAGPDGKRYAVGGEVSIDTSPARTPEETVVKAERIHDTAMAPKDPSPQDRNVAALAQAMALEARIEAASRRNERKLAATYGVKDAAARLLEAIA